MYNYILNYIIYILYMNRTELIWGHSTTMYNAQTPTIFCAQLHLETSWGDVAQLAQQLHPRHVPVPAWRRGPQWALWFRVSSHGLLPWCQPGLCICELGEAWFGDGGLVQGWFMVGVAIWKYDLKTGWTSWTWRSIMNLIEGSLEVELPTIWRDENCSQQGEESEEKPSEERRCRCAKR